MATHPLPPEHLPELVEAYAQTTQAVIDLASICSEGDFAKPTSCPGWTLKDHVSHVAGLESALDGQVDPEVEVPDYPYLRSDFGRFMEKAVEVRRTRAGSEIVDELRAVLPRRLESLRSPDLTDETLLPGPLGERPAAGVVTNRVMDIWCHEQDIRDVLGRPGNLDSPGAAVFISRLLTAFPILAAGPAGLEPGTAIILESTGPVTAREGVRLVAGPDGETVGEPLFSGESGDHGAESVTTIRLSTEALARRGAGRVSTEDTHYTVDGDESVARRLLDALAVTP